MEMIVGVRDCDFMHMKKHTQLAVTNNNTLLSVDVVKCSTLPSVFLTTLCHQVLFTPKAEIVVT